jgi:hypothetical protein
VLDTDQQEKTLRNHGTSLTVSSITSRCSSPQILENAMLPLGRSSFFAGVRTLRYEVIKKKTIEKLRLGYKEPCVDGFVERRFWEPAPMAMQ